MTTDTMLHSSRLHFLSFALALMMVLAGCGRQTDSASDLVEVEHRSPYYDTVATELDRGGVFYKYQDRTVQYDQIGELIAELKIPMQVFLSEYGVDFDFEGDSLMRVIQVLGLDSIKATGSSSYRLTNRQFSNRSFQYAPDGLGGLFRVNSTAASALSAPKNAPDDVDMVFAYDLDATVILSIVEELLGVFDNKQWFADWKALAGADDDMLASLKEGLEKMPRGVNLYLRLGAKTSIPVPVEGEIKMLQVPTPELIVELMGLDEKSVALIDKQFALFAVGEDDDDGLRRYRMRHALPLPGGIVPGGAWDAGNERFYITTSPPLLNALLDDDSPKLADNSIFKAAVNGLPEQGSQFVYLSPRFFSEFVDLRRHVFGHFPEVAVFIGAYGMQFPMLLVGDQDHGSAMVVENREHGILSVANWPLPISDHEIGQGSVVLVGMMGAMAIPAFNKVREQSREKTILNNLRMIAAGGQQFLLSEGVASVTYSQIVEAGYFPPIVSVAGEDYSELVVLETGGTLQVSTPGGLEVEYVY